MKCREFKTKQDALDFIKEHGGYYEIIVNEFACMLYVVFYK